MSVKIVSELRRLCHVQRPSGDVAELTADHAVQTLNATQCFRRRSRRDSIVDVSISLSHHLAVAELLFLLVYFIVTFYSAYTLAIILRFYFYVRLMRLGVKIP